MTRLVDELAASGNVIAIHIVDNRFVTLAYNAVPGLDVSQGLSKVDISYLQTVVDQGNTASYLDGAILKVMASVADAQGQTGGATLVYLPTEHVQAAIRRELQLAVVAATSWVNWRRSSGAWPARSTSASNG